MEDIIHLLDCFINEETFYKLTDREKYRFLDNLRKLLIFYDLGFEILTYDYLNTLIKSEEEKRGITIILKRIKEAGDIDIINQSIIQIQLTTEEYFPYIFS